MPLFPLDIVVLPQQIQPLHIFEPRYKQMVDRALDGAGQIAMAIFDGDDWKSEYHGSPPIKPAVCIGQIVQHERLPSGEYNILLQGVCRAQVMEESEPDGDRLYREANLRPLDLFKEPPSLPGTRERLIHHFTDTALQQLTACEWLLERLRNDDIPVTALLELISFTVLLDKATRYSLLAEPDIERRAEIIDEQLVTLDRMLRQAESQRPEDWPKGCSWN